jgi:hypothetical protein
MCFRTGQAELLEVALAGRDAHLHFAIGSRFGAEDRTGEREVVVGERGAQYRSAFCILIIRSIIASRPTLSTYGRGPFSGAGNYGGAVPFFYAIVKVAQLRLARVLMGDKHTHTRRHIKNARIESLGGLIKMPTYGNIDLCIYICAPVGIWSRFSSVT